MSRRKVLVFSGAGLSAESGIATFRDSDGLWENHRVEDVASLHGWKRDRALVLDFYRQRFEAVIQAQPNEGHLAIARLQDEFDVVNITQNIDDLLERAGCKDVIHLHGSVFRRKCEYHQDIPTGRVWGRQYACSYKADHTEPVGLADQCPACGANLRPDVVWFGEAVDMNEPELRKLLKEIKYNDGVFICVGTSAQVAPASFIIPWASQIKRKYIVNPQAWEIADYTIVQETAGTGLPRIVDELLGK